MRSAATAIILCGGRSTRMGQDKGAMRIAGESMLERVTQIASEVAREVIVVGRRDQPAATVHDSIEDEGPLAGIVAGLRASSSELNIVIACDMPLIRASVLRRLIERIGDHDMCVAVIDRRPSVLCGVYRSPVAGEAQALLDAGERRVMRLLDRVKVKRVDAAELRDLDPHLETFLSVDTPDKFAAVVARLTDP